MLGSKQPHVMWGCFCYMHKRVEFRLSQKKAHKFVFCSHLWIFTYLILPPLFYPHSLVILNLLAQFRKLLDLTLDFCVEMLII